MDYMNKIRQAAGLVIYAVTGGRICTKTVRQEARRRRAAWLDHARELQAALDDERARGWGFRYCDGRRVDF